MCSSDDVASLSAADALEAALTANLRRATRLRQAVLQGAFAPEFWGLLNV